LAALKAAATRRAELIGKIDLRLVESRNDRNRLLN